MDVQIIMTLRVTAPNIQLVADSVYDKIEAILWGANTAANSRNNILLDFKATEVRPNMTVTKFFTFPTDLDTIKPQTNERDISK